jgi:ADP-heptose:LPS heptosyltransferase
VIDTTGGLSLPQLGSLVSQCDAMVVNDSGLMHVASVFKVPTVVVFGASEPGAALPPYGRFRAVQHREVPCVPCLRNQCVRFGENYLECLKAVTVAEVSAALDMLLHAR